MARVFEYCFVFQAWSDSKMSNHGGKRENAGRLRGQGKYGEPTVTMRIPQSQGATIKTFWMHISVREQAPVMKNQTWMSFLFLPLAISRPCYRFFPPKWQQVFPVRQMIMSRKASMSVNF